MTHTELDEAIKAIEAKHPRLNVGGRIHGRHVWMWADSPNFSDPIRTTGYESIAGAREQLLILLSRVKGAKA